MSVLTVSDVTVEYGGVRALSGVSLSVDIGIIHSLIGPNGAGKTTLLNVCTGLSRARSGRVEYDGRRIDRLGLSRISRLGIARTFQHLRLFNELTAFENIQLAVERSVHAPLALDILRSRTAVRARRMAGERVDEILGFVGLSEVGDQKAGDLPYGHQRLLEIGRALACEPKLLLLDEPVAGMNLREKDAVARLIEAVKGMGISILLVEHSMNFIMKVSDVVTVLNYGEVLMSGDPVAVQADERVIEAYLGVANDQAHARLDGLERQDG